MGFFFLCSLEFPHFVQLVHCYMGIMTTVPSPVLFWVVQWPTCFLCAVNQSSFFIGKEADFVIFLQLIVCAVSIYLKTTAGEAVCCKFKQRLREPLE